MEAIVINKPKSSKYVFIEDFDLRKSLMEGGVLVKEFKKGDVITATQNTPGDQWVIWELKENWSYSIPLSLLRKKSIAIPSFTTKNIIIALAVMGVIFLAFKLLK